MEYLTWGGIIIKFLKENWIGILGYFVLMTIGILVWMIISAGFCELFSCVYEESGLR